MIDSEFIIPDIHLGARWDGIDRDDEATAFLDILIKDVEKDKPKRVLFLGDIFDSPHVSHSLIADFINVLSYMKDCDIEILMGNHDGSPKTVKGSPLEEVSACGNERLGITYGPHLDESTNSLFLPYAEVHEFLDKGKIDKSTIAYSHLDIEGVIPGVEKDLNRGSSTFLPDWVPYLCGHVYAGHIHRPQTKGNITIVGSVFKANIDEMNDQKRYIKRVNGQDTSVPIECRDLINFDIDYSTVNGKSLYNRLLNLKDGKTDSLMSVNLICPHNLAHEIDAIKLKDSLRKKVHHLRFNFDVVKEKNYRIKELEPSLSDVKMIEKFIESQGVTDGQRVLANAKCVLDEVKYV